MEVKLINAAHRLSQKPIKTPLITFFAICFQVLMTLLILDSA